MIEKMNIMLGICYAALAVCVLLTLFLLVLGDLILTVVFVAASLFVFAVTVVLKKERRITRLMNDDDYPDH